MCGKQFACLLVFVLIIGGLSSSVRAGTLHQAKLDVKVKIIGVARKTTFAPDPGASISNLGPKPFKRLWVKVKFALNDYAALAPDPLPMIIRRHLAKHHERLTATFSSGIVQYTREVSAVLAAHRRPLGMGVHGPLKAEGELVLRIFVDGDGRQRVSHLFHISKLEGPKGSWQSSYRPADFGSGGK